MTHIPISEFKPWSALQEKEPVFIMEEIEGSKYPHVTGSKMFDSAAERHMKSDKGFDPNIYKLQKSQAEHDYIIELRNRFRR